MENQWNTPIMYSKAIANSPELRHGSGLYVIFWTFFQDLVFFLIKVASNCLFICERIVSDYQLDFKSSRD